MAMELYRMVEALFPDADERGKVWAALLSKPAPDRPFYLLGVDAAVRSTLRSLLQSPVARRKRKADHDTPGKQGEEDPLFLMELLSCKQYNILLSIKNTLKQLPQLPFYNVEESKLDRQEDDEETDQNGEKVAQDVQPKWLVYDFGNAIAMQNFWCRSTRYTKIIERRSYVELWENHVCPAFFEESELVSFVILGNPGCGKSGFLLYVLCKLLELKKRVMLRAESGDYHLFELNADRPEGYSCIFNPDSSVLLEGSVFFLADGKLPKVPTFRCNAMLCCTPYKGNFKEFEKDGRCRTLYMPMWSADEIAVARQEIFPMIDLDFLQKRYEQWGGNPHFLFDRPNETLRPIIDNVHNIEMHVRALSMGEADANHPSHKLLQMQVEVGYQAFRYVFASPYVEEGIFKKLHETHKESLYRFIAFQGEAIGVYEALKSSLLQRYFKTKATRFAATYKVWRVFEDGHSCGPKEQRHFAFDELVEPDSLDTLVLPHGPDLYNKLYWPKSKNIEGIECFTITEKREGEVDKLDAFQVTLNCKRHGLGLKYKGILELMNKCGIAACNTRLYVVTLPELVGSVDYQDWWIKNKVLNSESIHAKLIGIQRYIMVCGWSSGMTA